MTQSSQVCEGLHVRGNVQAQPSCEGCQKYINQCIENAKRNEYSASRINSKMIYNIKHNNGITKEEYLRRAKACYEEAERIRIKISQVGYICRRHTYYKVQSKPVIRWKKVEPQQEVQKDIVPDINNVIDFPKL